MTTRSTKAVKKIEKPKPLKIMPTTRHPTSEVPGQISVASVEDILLLLDAVSSAISRKSLSDEIAYYTSTLLSKMKIFGQRLEESYKDKLDKAFGHFRNGSKDDGVDFGVRITLLNLIELRAMQWTVCASVNAYYLTRCSIPEVNDGFDASPVSNAATILSPGEIIKSSGKYSSPTKVPGKNYYRDEVVIRNSDSGKVSPGAKERNVQITGPEGEKVDYAKQLIEETIKRNASPIREMEKDIGSNSSLNSSASDDSTPIAANSTGKTNSPNYGREVWQYRHSVVVAGKTIRLSSDDHDWLKWAKLILETAAKNTGQDTVKFISKETQVPDQINNKVGSSFVAEPPAAELDIICNDPEPANEHKNESIKADNYENKCVLQKRSSVRITQYTRDFLLDLSCCNSAIKPPPKWDKVCLTYPNIVKQGTSYFNAELYSKKWLESEGKPLPIIDANLDCYDSE
ncbi:eukaryotic translation initiation factor mextil isoform X2 [Rhodnius prolixus]|uniref:eukaryotic translation initiation factor mextil isoform X2 n=1 Tax=Rhodnius prolixus TaxID=13249 RepID=UPI003D189466